MSARRITTAAAAVALAAGATFTAAPSAGAETPDLPSSVSDVTDGIQQSAWMSVILPVIAGSTTYCLITGFLDPNGNDNCPT
jgi:hypothetical protein